MPPALEERRILTVLFADLSGFTPLASKLDPEEVREAANLCFEHLNKAIAKQGGTVLKYEGDLVMALFGLPLAHEDDPERAVRASLAMLALLPEINQKLSAKLRIKTDLGLHIGVNSGTVVVGEIGSAEKHEYTVMGDAVNLGSRLKDAAKRGEVLVSEPVFRASRYLFEYEACPPVAVKGFEEPVKLFRPLREKQKPEPKRGIKGLYSPLVGRDRELAALQEMVGKLAEGKGGAAFVLGDAGLGKSRLLDELKKSLPELKAPVSLLEGRCLFYSETVPYWPFLQVLGEVFGITEQDTRESVKEKLLAKSKEIFPAAWEESVPYLGYLFSVRFPDGLDEKIKYLEAKDLKTGIQVSVRKLLAALSRARPLLVVVEDYHWIDSASLELLEFLFDSPEPFPMLLLALSRIEKDKEGNRTRERLKKKLGPAYRELFLEPLDEEAGSRLAYNLLQIPGITEGFKDKLLAKAEGNPFYLEEIIRSLIDSGALAYSGGVWRLTTDVSALEIPDTVQAVIAARLDRLEREVRDVLQMAAVLGRNFQSRLLEYLCGLDSLMLTLYLATLEEFEFIRESRSEPETEYAFRHPLSREVAYEGLLKKRRRELHRKAGEAVEELYQDRLEDFTELLAHQYAHSDNLEKALLWLKRAGRKAKDSFANDEAIAYYQKILALIEEEGGGRGGREEDLCASSEALGDICGVKGKYPEAIRYFEEMGRHASGDLIVRTRALTKTAEMYEQQSRFDEALAVLAEAEKDLSERSEAELLGKCDICIERCWIYRIRGDTDRAIREGETALRILEVDLREVRSGLDPKKVSQSRVRVFNSLGGIYNVKGEYDRAIKLYETCLTICEEIGDKHKMAAAQCNLGIMYYDKGEFDSSLQHYRTFLAICEEIGERRGTGTASGNMAIVYQDMGDYERAIELYGKALAIAQEVGDRLSFGMASGNLGIVYKSLGDYARATELFQTYYEISRDFGFKQGVGVAGLNLATLFQITGELPKAEEHLRKSEEIFRETGDKPTLTEVYASWADLKCLDGSSVQEALDYADRAFQLAQEVKSRGNLALAHWTYGSVFASSGDFARSEEHFRKALEGFEEMKQKRSLADVCLDYALMLKKGAVQGAFPPGQAEGFLGKARTIYGELNLPHKVKECI
jgi:class 3 adenylate cyclase/tetratricopeptide (TPR) repeat protein